MTDPLQVVQIPADVPTAQREAWLLVDALRVRVPDGWSVVGGQMVQFHGWRTGSTPTRTTTDLDVGIAARTAPLAFRALSAALQELGLKPVLHPSGVEHRWQGPPTEAGRVQVDLLLPSGLGERVQPSVNGRPGVQLRGMQWATDMSRLWHITIQGQRFVVPVPSLLGAVLVKASALRSGSDPDPGRHLSDIAFLAGVATRADLNERLTPKQATRVVGALDRIQKPSVEVIRLRMAMERVLRS